MNIFLLLLAGSVFIKAEKYGRLLAPEVKKFGIPSL
jgi:hypothetical protein